MKMFHKVVFRVSLFAYISTLLPLKPRQVFSFPPRNSKSLRSEREYVFEWTSTSQSSLQYVVVELYYYCLFNYLDFFPTNWENTIRYLYVFAYASGNLDARSDTPQHYPSESRFEHLLTYVLHTTLKLNTGLSSDQTFFGNQS